MAEVELLRSRANTLFPRAGGLHPPPAVYASWPRPNYVNPEEHGWEAPAVLIAILVITIMVYAARIWARLMISKNAGTDDLLMSIAMIPLVGLTISAVLGARIHGFQWHSWDQTKMTLVTSRKSAMAIELNYMVSTTLIKISILCFYRRITGSLTNSFVRWVWASIIFCAIYGILFIFLIIFTCSPVVGFFYLFDIMWRLKNEVSCHNEGAIIVACAIISTVQDLVICLLPIFLVWNLRMPKRQKLALCGIFGMGLVTCLCGIMRTYYATYVYYSTYDITWYAWYGWIWTALEADLGVICASAPALKVFFRRYLSSTTLAGSSGERSNNKRAYSAGSRNNGGSYGTSHSAGASHVEPKRAEDQGVPLGAIAVSQGLDIRVEDRDDISQRSFGSTSNLTALPAAAAAAAVASTKDTTWKTPHEWGHTVKSTLKQNSRSDLRINDFDKDIERGIR